MYVYQSFLMRLPDLAASEDIGFSRWKVHLSGEYFFPPATRGCLLCAGGVHRSVKSIFYPSTRHQPLAPHCCNDYAGSRRHI
jgi:hypothetical protein